MFTERHFVNVHKRQTYSKMSMNMYVDKQNEYIYRVEYYSATKRKELLMHAAIWMSLKVILVSERGQTQKYTSWLILVI